MYSGRSVLGENVEGWGGDDESAWMGGEGGCTITIHETDVRLAKFTALIHFVSH